MKIGNITIEGYAALAPMAGVADRAMREVCAAHGACYTVGEMASAKGLVMSDRKSEQLLDVKDEHYLCAVQLFGCEPDTMARAAEKAMKFDPPIIDINMGCPAPKVAKTGCGSALMKTPALAGEVVRAVVRAVNVPVTVKIRAGWNLDTLNAVEVAKTCEDAGASAIAVHGRTREQMYAPPVNIDIIRQVKEAVRIPVIGNGDIFTPRDAADMYEQTGCDLVMVGRGALGRPWLFAQINAWLGHQRVIPDPPVSERMRIMLGHVEKLCAYKGDRVGMREARKHAAWYMKGIRGAAAMRREIGELTSLEQLRELAFRAAVGAEQT
ncbi:MAG TPA: tRNA dihydrouridine synthase DusB [Candidatus Onthovicinus excrementipullorum]|nr:tRNA dihydrouridine synthase DusB [Candidatus Onthovicinus excrementipullorum]